MPMPEVANAPKQTDLDKRNSWQEMDDQQPAGLKEDGQQTLRALSNFETRLVILEAFGGNYVLSEEERGR